MACWMSDWDGPGKRGPGIALRSFGEEGVGGCGEDGDVRDRCTLNEAHRRAHHAQTEDRLGDGKKSKSNAEI